jgi:methylenetetrahydrofolate dehydrogenase (NADP+)/methenyltetrahydrofolate cyclohydrolase
VLISGKKVSEAIFDSLKKEVEILKTKNIVPSLVIVRVGDDPASVTYVGNKLKLCERLGVNGKLIRLEPAATQEELVSLINELNKDNQVNGILVQLPLPKHIDETIICQTISPDKDVDCFNEVNVGKL